MCRRFFRCALCGIILHYSVVYFSQENGSIRFPVFEALRLRGSSILLRAVLSQRAVDAGASEVEQGLGVEAVSLVVAEILHAQRKLRNELAEWRALSRSADENANKEQHHHRAPLLQHLDSEGVCVWTRTRLRKRSKIRKCLKF